VNSEIILSGKEQFLENLDRELEKQMLSLKDKKVIVGITGGIAAYKSADLTRRLVEAGAEVRIVMTEAATEFVTPLTFQALSGHPVYGRHGAEPSHKS
jgi:phosphopantothenoylcysteine synthetase/decarboxylase